MEHYLIGSNIRKYRTISGKKQSVFATEIGVSRVMLSRYENGHVCIKFQTLARIARVLGIHIELLYNA